jgi:hypothetical protein
MKITLAGCAVAAAAAILSVPAFAQTHVQSAGGVTVTSGTGVVVTPGVPAIVPVTTTAVPGAVLAQAGSATVAVDGRTTTTTTRYWVNVPPGAVQDPSFQRWQSLR